MTLYAFIKSISIILIFHFLLLPPPTPVNTFLCPTSFYSCHVMCMCLSVNDPVVI